MQKIGDESLLTDLPFDWVREIESYYIDEIAIDSQDNIYVTGKASNYLVFLAKYDYNGNQLWIEEFTPTYHGYNAFEEIAIDDEGNIYLTGYGLTAFGKYSDKDNWTVKYDGDGDQLWLEESSFPEIFINSGNNDQVIDNQGNIYKIGTNLAAEYNSDIWLAKYDSSDNQLWIRQFGSSDYDYVDDILIDSQNNLYLIGTTWGNLASVNSGGIDSWIAKYDDDGNQLWIEQIGSSDYGFSDPEMVIDSQNNLYLTDGNSNTWFAKLNPVNVNEQSTNVRFNNVVTELLENTENESGIKVADIEIIDDYLGTNNLELTGNNANSFEIRNENELYFIANNLNFEAQNQYQVTINVDDNTVGDTPDASTDFTLNLTDVHETSLNDPLFRFQNSDRLGTYLFAGQEESENIRANYPNFIEEGFAFNVSFQQQDDLTRFYRFQNSLLPGTYLYATEEESQNIRDNYPNFIEEGIAFYAYGADANKGVDYYRFQNTQEVGTYIFVGEEEKNSITANYPQFSLEGVAFEVNV